MIFVVDTEQRPLATCHPVRARRNKVFGFPDKAPKSTGVFGGFCTGDLVRAVVPVSGTKARVYIGRFAARATGECSTKTRTAGTVQRIHVRYCRPLQCGDGYTYSDQKGGAALPSLAA